jgi:hypothetical protein
MNMRRSLRRYRTLIMSSLVLVTIRAASLAQDHPQSKILGGYFEEWSIYYAAITLPTCSRTEWRIS